MNEYQLANLIFPNVKKTILDLEKIYPERILKEGAKVTRFAPSPTGFLHTGSLFTSLVASKIAKDTNGIFYTRLEDTDTKREVQGSGEILIKQLSKFDIVPNEGYLGDCEKGIYGPYKQSNRKEIYEIVIKEMISKGIAYPCFLSEEEINKIRAEQEKNNVITGIYGKYAIYRDLSIDEAIEKIKQGLPYVIRFKSSGSSTNKIKVHDEIRGDLELTENDQDIVILKSDGLPTYHFAHVCDDHFMHTNLVTRGEEWLPSLPIHIDLFKALGFKIPKYAHLPVIMKMDNGIRRKLSKRKDPEASVDYFFRAGYEPHALLVYLMTIANSNYEDYIVKTHDYNLDNFNFDLKKMSLDGALFDNDKLDYYSKEILGQMNKDVISSKAKSWASEYSPELLAFINNNEKRFVEIMNIERERKNPRKDYAKYSDIYDLIKFFDANEFNKLVPAAIKEFNQNIKREIIISFLNDYKDNYDISSDEQNWFIKVKEVAGKYNFCTDNKIFKENPSLYVGNINDACELIRIALTTKKVTPNLFSIMKILTSEEISYRIEKIISLL
jgi:Glutamyl- and glutaminyl-tRNA synthetases